MICAETFQPAEVNFVIDHYVIWDVYVDDISTYLEDIVWPNETMYQLASRKVDIGICGWHILVSRDTFAPAVVAGSNGRWFSRTSAICLL